MPYSPTEKQAGWWRLRRRDGLAIGMLLFSAAVAWLTAVLTNVQVVGEAQREVRRSLDIYVAYLQSEMRRFAILPEIVANAGEMGLVLLDPGHAGKVSLANAYLSRFNALAGSSAAYLMNTQGLTIAASNWNQDGTFLGKNYAFRPYFMEAMRGRLGSYVAVGVTSATAGHYVSHPVYLNGEILGVAVVKYGLENLIPWHHKREKLLIADASGVIFQASDPSFQFRTLQPLAPQLRQQIAESKQYGGRPLMPLAITAEQITEEGRVLTIQAPVANDVVQPLTAAMPKAPYTSPDIPYVIEEHILPAAGWHIVAMSSIAHRPSRILFHEMVAGLALGLVIVVLAYMEQRRKYMRTIYENAIRDPLTRLYTRFYMNDAVERMLHNHNRDIIRGCGLCIFDIDHFKRVNDTYGHHVGDDVLAKVASIILDEARATEIPVRFGGEELAVFLPVPGIADAAIFAERVRHRVETMPLPALSPPLTVTVSGGVAMHEKFQSLADLIIRADAELYRAKQNGRNRIHAAGVVEEPAGAKAALQPPEPVG